MTSWQRRQYVRQYILVDPSLWTDFGEASLYIRFYLYFIIYCYLGFYLNFNVKVNVNLVKFYHFLTLTFLGGDIICYSTGCDQTQ